MSPTTFSTLVQQKESTIGGNVNDAPRALAGVTKMMDTWKEESRSRGSLSCKTRTCGKEDSRRGRNPEEAIPTTRPG